MGTFLSTLVIGAAVVAGLSLLVQAAGGLLLIGLTVGAGLRDWWVNAAQAPARHEITSDRLP
jgi:hypothetical protein